MDKPKHSALKPSTIKAYEGIANYCRSGNLDFVANINLRKDRMHHYRRLVYNITNNALKQAYPLTAKCLSEKQWKAVVEAFFTKHNAQEYRVWQMPKEFYAFGVKENYAEQLQMPFLNDLLLLEWIEIEVHTMPDAVWQKDEKTFKNIWQKHWILNPAHRLVQLNYPVHTTIAHQIKATDKSNYFLLVYRSALKNQSVQFMEISVLYAYIVEQLTQSNNTLIQIVEQFIQIADIEMTESLKQDVIDFIEKLQKNGLLR